MRALLQTRCGCSREIAATWPAPPEIRIQLRTDWSSCWFDENSVPSETQHRTRRFTLVRTLGPFGLAEYMETA